MIVQKENTGITRYSIRFPLVDNPEIHYRCNWADIYLDHDRYTLMACTDCGNYVYGWPESEHESFIKFLAGIGKEYLLKKISKRTEFDLGKSKNSIIEELQEEMICAKDHGFEDDVQEFETQIEEVEEIEDVDEETFLELVEGMTNLDRSCLEELIDLEYPAWAKTFSEVFVNYLQPILKEEIKMLQSN